ncbi:MAG: YabP/YqfC family sporulation protein [Oscillospiraceae bacterium]|jgi:sporulation protein YabP|nr:YabP/YqfC family sporulation protein [Oscillospiraceae bacterium]
MTNKTNGATETKKTYPHSLTLDNRKKLRISGVCDIGEFNEECVLAFIDAGELRIYGSGLKIGKLSVETGELELSGNIYSLTYSDKKTFPTKNFFAKLFK